MEQVFGAVVKDRLGSMCPTSQCVGLSPGSSPDPCFLPVHVQEGNGVDSGSGFLLPM